MALLSICFTELGRLHTPSCGANTPCGTLDGTSPAPSAVSPGYTEGAAIHKAKELGRSGAAKENSAVSTPRSRLPGEARSPSSWTLQVRQGT